MADEVKIETLSDAEIEANRAKAASIDKLITPPEGQVLEGMRAFCPIHGEITYSNRILEYTLFRKNEKGTVFPVTYRDCVCEACLADMWREHCAKVMPKDENDAPQGITVSPVFIPKIEAAEKEVKMVEQVIENLKAKNAPEDKIKEAEDLLEKAKTTLAELEKEEAEDKKEEE